MRRRVYLHGSLKSIHQGPIEVVADTVADAIKKVTLQLPGFKPNAVRGRLRLSVVGHDTLESLFTKGEEEIHLVHSFSGGKNGGIFMVIIGAALVAASFFMPASLSFLAPIMMQTGVLLVLGGILQLLQTPPTSNKSHYLGSPQNTVAIGTPIAILYGRRKVGGQLLSVNVEAVSI